MDNKISVTKIRDRTISQKWQVRLASFKRNEICLEQFGQLIIISLFVFLQRSKSSIMTLPSGLENSQSWVLALTMPISLLSPARGLASSYATYDDVEIGVFGNVLLFLYYLTCVIARAMGIILYFTPAFGLFDTLMHWRKGKIPCSTDVYQIYDIELYDNYTIKQRIMFQDIWEQLNDVSDLTLLDMSGFCVSLVCFFCLHFVIVYFIKRRMSQQFILAKNWSEKLSHVLWHTIVPFPFKEWHINYDISPQSFNKLWSSNRSEMINLLTLFGFENLILTIPIWILFFKIQKRNYYLYEYFYPLPEELQSSWNVQALLISSVIIFPSLAFLQFCLWRIYHQLGHPWKKIFQLEQKQFSISKTPGRSDTEDIQLETYSAD